MRGLARMEIFPAALALENGGKVALVGLVGEFDGHGTSVAQIPANASRLSPQKSPSSRSLRNQRL